jgi:hypothetical protein
MTSLVPHPGDSSTPVISGLFEAIGLKVLQSDWVGMTAYGEVIPYAEWTPQQTNKAGWATYEKATGTAQCERGMPWACIPPVSADGAKIRFIVFDWREVSDASFAEFTRKTTLAEWGSVLRAGVHGFVEAGPTEADAELPDVGAWLTDEFPLARVDPADADNSAGSAT